LRNLIVDTFGDFAADSFFARQALTTWACRYHKPATYGDSYPYFHNGEAETLTGEQPRFILSVLPPSSDATPQPQPFD